MSSSNFDDFVDEVVEESAQPAAAITQVSPRHNPPPSVSDGELQLAAIVLQNYATNRETTIPEIIDAFATSNDTNAYSDTISHEVFAGPNSSNILHGIIDGTIDGPSLQRQIRAILIKVTSAKDHVVVESLQQIAKKWQHDFDKRPSPSPVDIFYEQHFYNTYDPTSFSVIDQFLSGDVCLPSFNDQFPSIVLSNQYIQSQASRKALSLQERLALLPFLVTLAIQGIEEFDDNSLHAARYLGATDIDFAKDFSNNISKTNLQSNDVVFPLVNPEMMLPSYDDPCIAPLVTSLSPKHQYIIKLWSRFVSECHLLLDARGAILKNMPVDVKTFDTFFGEAYIALSRKSSSRKQKHQSSGGDPDDDPFFYDDDGDDSEEESDDETSLNENYIPIPLKGEGFFNNEGRKFGVWITRQLIDILNDRLIVANALMYKKSAEVRTLYGQRGELTRLSKKIKIMIKDMGVSVVTFLHHLCINKLTSLSYFSRSAIGAPCLSTK